ncbi:hypothetical protein, partial [Streptomyces massasporeus]|uniref:hypothetical protein n=1 Tax=Streptomyces massasporeus TaxID=67324 RepID=UPI003F540549
MNTSVWAVAVARPSSAPGVSRCTDVNAAISTAGILKDASAPGEWRFPLDLEGLTARLDDHGGLVF